MFRCETRRGRAAASQNKHTKHKRNTNGKERKRNNQKKKQKHRLPHTRSTPSLPLALSSLLSPPRTNSATQIHTHTLSPPLPLPFSLRLATTVGKPEEKQAEHEELCPRSVPLPPPPSLPQRAPSDRTKKQACPWAQNACLFHTVSLFPPTHPPAPPPPPHPLQLGN